MLAFLHTARVHVETFDRLAKELDGTIPIRHEVRESLLAAALEAGAVTEPVQAATAEAVQDLARDGAKVIVCTCSTIGGVAEATPVPDGVLVMRIDRPMTEQAVASGRRILVLAALGSTFEPTLTLLRQIASSTNRSVDVVEVLCETAWKFFDVGDHAAYAGDIARTVEAVARPNDVVLLAQASMAPVADLVGHLGIPVLSSPKPGLAAAMSRYRAMRVVLGVSVCLLLGCGTSDRDPARGGDGTGGSSGGAGGAMTGGASGTGGGLPGGAGSGGVSSSGDTGNGGASASGGAGSGGVSASGGGGAPASGGAAGGSIGDRFARFKRRPDVQAIPVADCAGQPDMALCRVATTPDRDYDVCVGGVCVSPGCEDPSCNVPSPHFPIPPSSYHTYLEKIPGGEPTVADLVTGLEWQGCAIGTAGADCTGGALERLTRQAAVTRCDALTWGGKNDWYLPDSYELLSLVDFAATHPRGIDTALFGVPNGPFWTTHGSGNYVFFVQFGPPGAGAGTLIGDAFGNTEFSVRCVRRGASSDVGYTGDRFRTALPGSIQPVVVDRATGLTWQRCVPDHSGPECEADGTRLIPTDQMSSHCDALQWGGASDWRLPTFKELHTLAQFSTVTAGVDRAVNPEIFDVQSGPYLGGTSGWEPDATFVLMDDRSGAKIVPHPEGTYSVLCVRWTEP